MNEEFEDAWVDGEGPVQEALAKARKQAEDEKSKDEPRSDYEKAFDEGESK